MKKNENILKYLEKYKYKYGISYAEENGKLAKFFSVAVSVLWVYSFFTSVLSILSFSLNFKVGTLEYTDFDSAFITTIVCAVVMIAAAALFVCNFKVAGCITAVITQPFTVLAYENISKYGTGYLAGFYWKYLIPAILITVFSALLLTVIIRARVKTNRLYNNLIDGLYKKYGTKDGQKLTDSEWEDFLSRYNPYKQIT